MAGKRNPSDPAAPVARPPKKPQTIELAASEFASDSGSPKEAEAPPGASTASSKDADARPRPGTNWPLIGAGFLGAMGLALAWALFWFTGAIGNGAVPGDRLAGIEAQLRDLAARPAGDRADTKALDELSVRLARVEKAAAAPQAPSSDATVKSLADEIAGLKQRVDDLTAIVRAIPPPADRAEIEALNNRIAALEKSAGTMESELGKRATLASDRATRLALASSALRSAVERGEPFTAELAAARPLAGKNAFESLEPFAASGVPSNLALARELSTLVPALRNAANAMPVEGGFFERIKSSASRLVRIRPSDESPSDDPAAVIARVDAKAAHADVAGALVELDKLPPAVRAPAQAWIEKARARIAAIETSRKIAADAIHALGKAVP